MTRAETIIFNNVEEMEKNFFSVVILGAALATKRKDQKYLNLIAQRATLPMLLVKENSQEKTVLDRYKDVIEKLQVCSEEELISEILNRKDRLIYTDEDYMELMCNLLKIKKGSDVASICKTPSEVERKLVKDKKVNLDVYSKNPNKKLEITKYALKDEINFFEKNILEDKIQKKYDFVIVSSEKMEEDKSNYIICNKVLNMLKDNGKAALFMLNANLANTIERTSRQKLIEKNYIEEVIKLPAFFNYKNDYSIIILNKAKIGTDIKFVDFSNPKEKQEEKSVIISKEDIIEHYYSLNSDFYLRKIPIKNGVKLVDIIDDLFRGYQITDKEYKEMVTTNPNNAKYSILEIGNINEEGKIDAHNQKMIGQNGKNLDRYLIKDGDIVMTARGSNLKIALKGEFDPNNMIANGSINVIRVNPQKMNPRYLKMFFDNPKGKQAIKTITIGREKTPSINTGNLKNLIVPCPPIEEQNEIAEEYEEIAEEIEYLKNKLQNKVNNLI